MAKRPHRRMSWKSTSLHGISDKDLTRIVHALLKHHGHKGRYGKRGLTIREIKGNIAVLVHEARRKLRKRHAANAKARARYHHSKRRR